MLTAIQKSRVRFHLGYPNDQIRGPLLEIAQKLVLGNLPPETELAIAGNPAEQTVEFQGEVLCAADSLLERLEVAWSNLGPGTIDDSLFVSQAGSAYLRRDELKARKALYAEIRKQLATLLDVELFGDSGCLGPFHSY